MGNETQETTAIATEQVAVPEVAEKKSEIQGMDFSWLETRQDSPELAAYKAKVVAVAKRYKSNHGWCSVVDAALEEMEATPPRREKAVEVKVRLSFGPTLNLRIIPSDYKDLSPEQQRETLARNLGNLSIAGLIGSGSMRLKAADIVATEVQVPNQPVAPVTLTSARGVQPDTPEWVYRYLSYDGRTYHAIRPDSMQTAQRDRGNITTACGSESYYYSLRTESGRGQGRLCTRCETAMRNV